MELIPAIDLLDGKVVRLHQGKYDEVTVYNDDPVAMASAMRHGIIAGRLAYLAGRMEAREREVFTLLREEFLAE